MAKLTKHELRAPDEVWKASKSAFQFMQNQWVLLVVLSTLILATMIGGVYYWQSQKKFEGAAGHHYALAKSYLEQWKLAEQKEKEGSLSKAKAELQTLESDYVNSEAQVMAHLLRARLAKEENQTDEAIRYYQAYISKMTGAAREVGQYPLAIFYENQKAFNQSLELYRSILENKKSMYRKLALLGEGRSLRALSKSEEAKESYQIFLEEFPESPDAGKVRGLLSLSDLGSN